MSKSRDGSPASGPPLKDLGQAMHVEEYPSEEKAPPEVHPEEVSPEQHKAMFRKIDVRLMPLLMMLYLIANLDR